jgi:hypothetical protein
MAANAWTDAIESIREHIFLVQTPSGQGTGFLAPSLPGSKLECIITARHVIEHAQEWKEPIKLTHFPTKKEIFLNEKLRNIKWHPNRDTAIIEFPATRPPLPSNDIKLIREDIRLKEGYQIGWLGFPSVAPRNMCFFCGHVSAWLDFEEAYLVDGVAIHGVSGGPAFAMNEDGETAVVGLVTEYRPNMCQGNALPGVSLVRAINPLLRLYSDLQKHIDDASGQDTKKIDGNKSTLIEAPKNAVVPTAPPNEKGTI